MSMDKETYVGFCPHCGNVAPQKGVYAHSYEADAYEMDGTPAPNGLDCEYHVLICATCDEILLYHSMLDDPPVLVYPKSPDLDESVPKKVRECYTEAARVRKAAPNAYAVMLRRALEALCDERKVKKGTLFQRLDELAKRGDIPPNSSRDDHGPARSWQCRRASCPAPRYCADDVGYGRFFPGGS